MRGTAQRRKLRLFLDSNVLTGGMVARWGLDRAVLALCAARICRLVLAEAVRAEVEENLLLHAAKLTSAEADELLEDYVRLIDLSRPEVVPWPDRALVLSSRRLIAHQADVPILVSATRARPDWLLTHNTKHFTPRVAARTGLRIGSPADFFQQLSQGIAERPPHGRQPI
ncbi:MAG: PIN domain-containing protein [Planctomycetes bacterium]|nr:PIN domain-containing protein [Planctomycetota bacterium]